MPKDHTLTVTFPSKESKDMALRGLKDLQSLFQMRFDEATDAGATNAGFRAAEDLVNVMTAMSVFKE